MCATNVNRSAFKLAPAMAVAMAACGVVGGQDAPVQQGQIVGGATKQVAQVQSVGGFLPQPSLLAEGGRGRPAWVYLNPNVKSASYCKVMLDPVAIRAASGSELGAVPASQRDDLAIRFQRAVSQALSQRCRMVTAPSAATLRLRFALTDATQTDPVVNTVTTYTPYLSAAVSAASLAFNSGVGYFAGAASVEGYATDAVTGKLLWQAVDKRAGTGAVVKDTFDNWLDIDRAMQDWSEKLAARLQELGACKG